MTSTLFVVAKSNKSYYNALKYESSKSSEEIRSSILFLELGECFALVESCVARRNLNDDGSMPNAPTIVVDADEIVFLEEVYKMLMERNTKRPLFKLLIVTSLDHWAGDIFQDSVHSCSDLILQRSQVHGLFESERITRLALELLESNMIQCHFVVVGNVYGGNGLDFTSLLWSIWNQDAITTEAFTNAGHIGCVFSPDLFNLLFNLRSPVSSENQSLIITAFEDPSLCFSRIITEFCTKLNGENKKESTAVDLSGLVLRSYDLSNFQPFYANLMEINNIGANFQTLWDTFIHENGLNPINVLVTGPPRSRKSEIAKDISERLSLQIISVPNSIVFAFEFCEKVESGEFEKDNVNVDKLQESLRMLTSAIEAKVAEQSAATKKGGKDKNASAVPTDAKLEVSQLSEALCYSLPDDIIKIAISIQLMFERLSKRKGFVLDVWERDLFTEFDDLFSLRTRFLQEDSNPKSALFNCVIEVQATSKLIIDRQLETMGPQQAKSKEGQATIKTLEGTLETFNSKVTKRDLGEEKFVDSAKVFDALYLNDPQFDGVIKLFPNSLDITAFSFDNLHSELINMYSNIFGRSIPWLKSSNNDQGNVATTAGIISDEIACQLDEIEPSEESKENITQVSLSQSDYQAVKYNDFLANTSLPIITSTMVAIIRENPEDPIMFLAESLLAESEKRQELAYSDAFKKFMELLNS